MKISQVSIVEFGTKLSNFKIIRAIYQNKEIFFWYYQMMVKSYLINLKGEKDQIVYNTLYWKFLKKIN